MTNQNTNNNGRNNNPLETALETIIAECKNVVKLSELEKLAVGTDCEGDYVCSSENITEKLQKAKEEVERLESIISECEETKKRAEEEARKEEEKQEKFLASLTPSGREVLSYLEGMKALAQGENLDMVNNIIRVFYKYTGGCELTLLANLAAYVAILCKEEKYDQIRLLETVTLKVDQIQCNNKGTPDPKVNGLDRILLAVQDIY